MLFESVNAQISISKQAKDVKYIYEVLVECADTLSYYQKCITEVITQSKDLEFYYLLALINNHSKSYE